VGNATREVFDSLGASLSWWYTNTIAGFGQLPFAICYLLFA
jgi:hypothetical protein